MENEADLRNWLSWVAANSVGELLGLGIVFSCGFAVVHFLGEPRSTATILLFTAIAVALGAVEGAVVGYAQWLVIRRLLPQLAKRSWVVSTVIGAVVAWLLGMIPSTIGSLQSSSSATPPAPEPPQSVVLMLAAATGVVGGLVLSGAQWRVLRRQGAGAAWWLPANAAAWAIGMPWIFWLVGATLAEGQTPTSFLLFLGGLGVAGALVGAVHGAFLIGVLAPKWRVAQPLLAAGQYPAIRPGIAAELRRR